MRIRRPAYREKRGGRAVGIPYRDLPIGIPYRESLEGIPIGNPYRDSLYRESLYRDSLYRESLYRESLIWSPGLPKSSRFAKKVILGGKAHFWRKNHFLRKSRFWREKTQILLPKWKKRGKGGPKHQRNDRFRSSLRNGAAMVQKVITKRKKNTHIFAKK